MSRQCLFSALSSVRVLNDTPVSSGVKWLPQISRSRFRIQYIGMDNTIVQLSSGTNFCSDVLGVRVK